MRNSSDTSDSSWSTNIQTAERLMSELLIMFMVGGIAGAVVVGYAMYRLGRWWVKK